MKKLILLASTALALASCDLDRAPMNTIVADELLSNSNSIVSVTNGNYALLKGNANGGGFYNNLYRVIEYGGDNVSLSGTTTDSFFFMYNYKSIKNNARDGVIWDAGFRTIIGCNKVITISKEGQSSDIDQLIGENYFLRAYTYFQLVNVFGKPYYQGRGNLGVPLKTGVDVSDLPARATVGEVYDQIVSDLLKAEQLMTNNSSRIRATKIAAQGLLSRVYLYMNENQKAIEYADKVINSGARSLISNTEFPNYVKLDPESNSETIFAFKYNKDGDYNHGWYTIGSMFANIDGVGWGEMYASSSYLNLLEQNPDDVRLKFIQPVYTLDKGQKIPAIYWISSDYKSYQFRRTQTDNTGQIYFTEDNVDYPILTENTAHYINYKGEKIYVKKDFDMEKRNGYPKFYITKTSLQQGVPHLYSPIILRLAEMYLNRAEAYAKLGNVNKAIEDINIIRTRAGIPTYTNLPSTSTIVDIVLQERRAELAFEGHSKFDIFRNGKTLNRKYPGTHLSGNNPFYEIAPDNNRVIQYIPEGQILAQPNLVQNPD